ncbi:hypothetical protein QVD17_06926 [Tagetes erecta]|uniref:Uncharacterized protein n=1 Tax=Tagetes erecta TaxID=13708 RepID=A0AAD8LF56_TARER|nr:hypothetical protein QVD17_06926 [Tagetes erecta]
MLVILGLVILGDLPLFEITMQMRLPLRFQDVSYVCEAPFHQVFISLRIFEAVVLTPVIEQRAVFEAEGQIRYEYVLFVSNCRDLKGVFVCDDNGVTWDPNV